MECSNANNPKKKKKENSNTKYTTQINQELCNHGRLYHTEN